MGFLTLPKSGVGLITQSKEFNLDEQAIADGLTAADIVFDHLVDPERQPSIGADADMIIATPRHVK